MFNVTGTETYLKEIDKWTREDKEAAEKLPAKLAVNPFVGDQLGYPFLREKRVGGKRVYFLIYEDLKLVLLVATSEKKNQQVTINHIKEHLDKFREIAQEVIKQAS